MRGDRDAAARRGAPLAEPGARETVRRAGSWWEVHDRARRDAISLLIIASAICAAYLGTVLLIVVSALRVGEFGPWRGIRTAESRLGPFGLTVLAITLLAIAAATISLLAWAGLAQHVLRRARARSPRPGEAEHVQSVVSDFALGLGLAPPRVWIVDDPAVNVFATGRMRAPQIVLTSGALALPPAELEALCAHTLTYGSQRATHLAAAAAAVILDADWCTRMVWGFGGAVFVSGLFGVPGEVVALSILGITLLVVVTKPLVIVASGAIVRLLDRAAELTDLETVRVTNRPVPMAELMLDTVEHRAAVESAWDIAHLWFDPETDTRATGWWSPTVRPIAGADSRRTRAALVDRAQVLVDLAEGDHRLRRRLDVAARAAREDPPG